MLHSFCGGTLCCAFCCGLAPPSPYWTLGTTLPRITFPLCVKLNCTNERRPQIQKLEMKRQLAVLDCQEVNCWRLPQDQQAAQASPSRSPTTGNSPPPCLFQGFSLTLIMIFLIYFFLLFVKVYLLFWDWDRVCMLV